MNVQGDRRRVKSRHSGLNGIDWKVDEGKSPLSKSGRGRWRRTLAIIIASLNFASVSVSFQHSAATQYLCPQPRKRSGQYDSLLETEDAKSHVES